MRATSLVMCTAVVLGAGVGDAGAAAALVESLFAPMPLDGLGWPQALALGVGGLGAIGYMAVRRRGD